MRAASTAPYGASEENGCGVWEALLQTRPSRLCCPSLPSSPLPPLPLHCLLPWLCFEQEAAGASPELFGPFGLVLSSVRCACQEKLLGPFSPSVKQLVFLYVFGKCGADHF